jgi:hypothetical protein
MGRRCGRANAEARAVGPHLIESVTIFAHSDAAGREGAHALAQALAHHNRNKKDPFSAEIRMEGFE